MKRFIEYSLLFFFASLFFPLKLRAYEVIPFFSGDFHPYSTFFLYFSDVFFLFVLLFISLYFFLDPARLRAFSFGSRGIMAFWICFMILGQIGIFFSPVPFLSFLFLLRWVQMFLVYLFIIADFVPKQRLFAVLILGLVFESVVAILQYFIGTSVGLSFLGEPPISVSATGVSVISVFGKSFLRGYGTFLHPNILAAFLLFGLYALSEIKCLLVLRFRWIVFLLFVFALCVTFSRVALIAFFVFVFWYLLQTHHRLSIRREGIYGVFILFLLTFFNVGSVLLQRFAFLDVDALTARFSNFFMGLSLFLERPFGTGLGASGIFLQSAAPQKLSPWEYQPSHNFFLHTANELGVFGLLLFSVAAFLFLRKILSARGQKPLFFALGGSMFFLSFFDHYFFTSFQGQILFTLLIALFSLEFWQRDQATSISV